MVDEDRRLYGDERSNNEHPVTNHHIICHQHEPDGARGCGLHVTSFIAGNRS
jgi:hypothetical protein